MVIVWSLDDQEYGRVYSPAMIPFSFGSWYMLKNNNKMFSDIYYFLFLLQFFNEPFWAIFHFDAVF